ncbi:ubiquitin-conjugating enzyme/RWD-like protein [Leucosporidium creatinivorum]|uniref:Ubiquitin-conjugating enzyme/RWD-like protein n=1 Tax=Leucosporidium creatinivorum TaxID=106004 RepID=A0A1Y2BY82_9BASI|nr:ubiquitin-conjugating enzyme/RWD-like protein [Leucosporidium creatinivorum]
MNSTTARQEVFLEFSALGSELHSPTGMYILPLQADPFTWHGVIFLHKGYYAGAVLKFTLSIPSSYPSSPPTLSVQTPCFHPLIDPATTRVKLDGRFPRWRPREDFLFHVLHFFKSMFKRAALDQLTEGSCANREAYRLYRDQTPLFAKLASQSAALSITESSLFAPPLPSHTKPSPIQFRKLEEGEEETLKEKIEEAGRARLISSRRPPGLA